MAALTVQQIALTGLDAAVAAAAGAAGDTFINNGRTFIKVTDTGTTAPVVTIASRVTCSRGSTHNVAVTVASGTERFIGPFPMDRFNDADGKVSVTYSAVTDVTVEVFTI